MPVTAPPRRGLLTLVTGAPAMVVVGAAHHEAVVLSAGTPRQLAGAGDRARGSTGTQRAEVIDSSPDRRVADRRGRRRRALRSGVCRSGGGGPHSGASCG